MSGAGLAGARRCPRSAAVALGAAVSLGIALPAISCAPLGAGSSAVPSSAGRVTMASFAPLVREVIPAVVNVSAVQRPGKAADQEMNLEARPVKGRDTASGLPPSALDELLRRFFGERNGSPNLPGLALGSGFIIDPDGYIVTDDHVLENSDSVTVTFHDARQYKARNHRARRA